MKYARKGKGDFYLQKWFLDFVSDEGEVMIFYAATLRWHKWQIPYSSWLHFDPASGTSHRSSIRHNAFPQKRDSCIEWNHPRFGITGRWEQAAPPLQSRIFKSKEGYLDWTCFQPASHVHLTFKDRTIHGTGYAEQLVLTVLPWLIPMHELRWGRFNSPKNNLVWIELKGKEKQQWFWHNGQKLETVEIEDHSLNLPTKSMSLELDQRTVLESKKKILQVVKLLTGFLPGFNKIIPLYFLNADEFKWLSRGTLYRKREKIESGWAIHEYVNFNLKPA